MLFGSCSATSGPPSGWQSGFVHRGRRQEAGAQRLQAPATRGSAGTGDFAAGEGANPRPRCERAGTRRAPGSSAHIRARRAVPPSSRRAVCSPPAPAAARASPRLPSHRFSCGLASRHLRRAFVARELYYGRAPILGASSGASRPTGCRSPSLITVLVFSQAGSTTERRRGGRASAVRLVADPRRADHARLRGRHRARVLDVRGSAPTARDPARAR